MEDLIKQYAGAKRIVNDYRKLYATEISRVQEPYVSRYQFLVALYIDARNQLHDYYKKEVMIP